ncbi:hypothetical protein [Bosea sp. UNC402CLCol]|uniref:hypothetical protein n=1 Tax=Bosea sp. UNC402CLCol TaxID=1510531 RepID=UPI0012E07F07|nr:hypothetical protein [Bosea sp. UNC402CLCol]
MNNQSSSADQKQNSASLALLFGPELYPMIAGLQHITSRHPRIDAESTAIFLKLMRKGDLTLPKAEAVESTEGLDYLTKARLISVAEVGGSFTIALTETGRELAAEVMGLFEPKASPLQ